MLHGETTKRSDLDPEALVTRLQTRGVAQLAGETAIWVALDGSDLRKPHASAMEHLQRVKPLKGDGLVPGYRTLNALGIGTSGRRGLLYHRLFSSHAPDFLSESSEVQTALRTVGAALAPLEAEVTWLIDSGFDDIAVWDTIWDQDQHLVVRVQHRDRLVTRQDGTACHLEEVAPHLTRLATVEAELVVKKTGQRREKLQPVTVEVAATPLVVQYRHAARTRADGEQRTQAVWLVEVRLRHVSSEPWWLLTDHSVATAEAALLLFRMYCMRWAIEDTAKVAKQCLGWEEVQLLAYEAVRLLVALGWVAAGFLYELGVTLEWPELRLLTRLGGGEERPYRPPGKQVLMRGLRRLFDLYATEVILAEEVRRHGRLPPRLAALLGRSTMS
jgi:hypothetical protein